MSRIPFKYKKFHAELGCKCPSLENLHEFDDIAYRFVIEDLNHFNNHNPPYVIAPARIDSEDCCDVKCKGYAISLFTDLKKAENKLKKFLATKPLLSNVLGNCIGKIQVTPECGMVDIPNIKDTHFNLHEFENHKSFNITIVTKIE